MSPLKRTNRLANSQSFVSTTQVVEQIRPLGGTSTSFKRMVSPSLVTPSKLQNSRVISSIVKGNSGSLQKVVVRTPGRGRFTKKVVVTTQSPFRRPASPLKKVVTTTVVTSSPKRRFLGSSSKKMTTTVIQGGCGTGRRSAQNVSALKRSQER